MWPVGPKCSEEEAVDLQLAYWAWQKHFKGYLERLGIGHLCRHTASCWRPHVAIKLLSVDPCEVDRRSAVQAAGRLRRTICRGS